MSTRVRLKKNELYNMVDTVLHDIPETRDDDILLWCQVIRKYYKQHIFLNEISKECIQLRSLLKLPQEGNTQRHRRHIQHIEKRHLPLKIETVRSRKQNEDVWRLLMSKPDTL